MKTNKLPQSEWSGSQAAGSQSQQTSQSTANYSSYDKAKQTGSASNDAHYDSGYPHHLLQNTFLQKPCFAYKRFDNNLTKAEGSAMNKEVNTVKKNITAPKTSIESSYKKANKASDIAPSVTQSYDKPMDGHTGRLQNDFKQNNTELRNSAKPYSLKQGNDKLDKHNIPPAISTSNTEISERIFMNGLVKHTAIALAIIIPLAAFSAYAAPPILPINTIATNARTDKTTTTTLAIEPSAIIHKSASMPTTVDNVDLEKYAGTWYEIGRLPMYFQRNCARNVTATYTGKTDGSGITVLNQCIGTDGKVISAEGLAKPSDNTDSKLKVTFLPSWIRWLPVGRANYWVLARDANYQTALVGTPDHDYLWLLARSPNITQQTYAKYRQIAQQQGYNLKEFKLTTQTNQTVNLVP